MRIYFTNASIHKYTLKRLIQGALKFLGQPFDKLEISLSIVTPEEIQQLNKEFRGVDSVTDVLSFPTVDVEKKVVVVEEFGADVVNEKTGKLNLGDVIICLDRAKVQAEEYGHSLNRELCFLSLHGLLHLLGYDHVEPQDEQQMNDIQEQILNNLHITRDVK